MSTNDLTPKQRAAVRRMRQALALVPEPERRMILAALKEFWQAAMAPMLADVEPQREEYRAVARHRRAARA